MQKLLRIVVCFLVTILLSSLTRAQWEMHVIDNSSRGADGVRLADFNHDGMLDIVTGWEEGGVIRVYQNPGPNHVKKQWPAATVGRVKSPEDAVFVDLDADGILDVVSCCEGKTKTVFVNWAPKKRSRYLMAEEWQTEAIPATEGIAAWMFAAPSEIDRKNGVDLFLGAKGRGASVSWLEAPVNPRDVSQWKLHRIENAGWIMSMRSLKLGGQVALLVSDRKGPRRGVYFLKMEKQNPKNWKRIDLSEKPLEYMFLDLNVGERNKRYPSHWIAVATRNGTILQIKVDSSAKVTRVDEINNPEKIVNGKAVAIGDIDLDGKIDLVHSSNTQSVAKAKMIPGLHWLEKKDEQYKSHRIADSAGRKFDRIELLDLDHDGDLDVLTCEEAANLGVIWFENPLR